MPLILPIHTAPLILHLFASEPPLLTFVRRYDSDGLGGPDLVLLRREWCVFFSWRRIKSFINIFAYPNDGIDQPLGDIRAYFGDEICLYFMFLGFFSKWLLYPAVTGAFFFIWQRLYGSDSNILFLFSISLCVWAWLMIHNWKRQEAKIVVQWGYKNERLKERVRRKYRVPRHEDVARSDRQRKILMTFSYVLVICMVLLSIASFLAFTVYYSRFMGDSEYASTGAAVIHSVIILLLEALNGHLAELTTNWENHKFESSWNNNRIRKVFVFDIVNNMISLFFLAYYSPLVKGTSYDPYTAAYRAVQLPILDDLSNKLATIFVIRLIVGNIKEALVPYVKYIIEKKREMQQMKGVSVEQQLSPTSQHDEFSSEPPPSSNNDALEECSKKAWSDLDRETYEGVHLDYAELALQFAFLMLFGVSFPIVAALAWASNFVEIWIDSFKLCWVLRRPMPRRAIGIPKVWMEIFQGVAFLAVVTNGGILTFSSSSLMTYLTSNGLIDDPFRSMNRLIVFFLVEHAIFIGIAVTLAFIPQIPKFTKYYSAAESLVLEAIMTHRTANL
jgi:hypothetical protein